MADGQSQRDIQLVIRASDLSSKTFQDVAKSVDNVTSSLESQVKAAQKGEVSAGELRDTLTQLQKAGDALIKQQGLVDLYAKLEGQLADTASTADGLRAKFVELNNSGGLDGLTKKQTADLASLQKSLDAAERKVETTQASMAVQSSRLASAGLNAGDLAGAQAAIAASASQVGAAIGQVNSVLTNYNTTLRETKTQQTSLNAAMSEANSTASFRKMGSDAVLAANNLQTLGTAESQAGAQTSNLAKSLLSLLDPSAHAVTTLAGLEARTTDLAAEIGDATKPIYNYTGAINGLSQAQSAILSQAKSIDAYKNQTLAVNEASEAFETARTKVLQYGAAVAAATEPDEVLAASLATSRAQMTAANAALDAQKAKLDGLAASLIKAEVDTNDLAAAENRLQATANIAAGAAAKIAKAQSGANSPAGSFLGLRPYELQNLSYQVNDIFTQLASGTKPMQVLAQQGGQVAQIFPEAITAIISFIPEILAAVAVLTTLYSAFKRITDLEADERKFAAAMQLSADGAKYNADQLALVARGLTDLGVKSADATKAVNLFTEKGLDPSKLAQYTTMAFNLSKVTGSDLPTAMGMLVNASTGGYKAIADLDDKINFLTVTQRANIKAMFDSGNATGAVSAAMDILKTKTTDLARQTQGPWADAIKDLGHAWQGFLDTIGNTGIIQGTINELNTLAGLADKFGPKAGASAQAPGANGLPGGVQFQRPGLGAIALGGLLGGPGGALQVAQQPKEAVITPEIRDIVVTAMKEANANDLQGQQDVVSVILNRMAQSGLNGSQVVRAQGQFQPWMGKGEAALESIDVNSKEFVTALNNLIPLLQGTQASTVGKAVNFYSPGGQRANVRNGLSKDLVPAFAQGQTPVAVRGGQQFFNGTFPGQKPNPTDVAAAAASEVALKAGQDYVANLQMQIEQTNKVNDAETVRLAGLQALRGAQEAGADAGSQQKAKALAEAEAQRQVDAQRLEERQTLLSRLAGLEQQSSEGETANLDSRLKAVTDRYNAAFAAIGELEKKGLTQDGTGQSLEDVKAQLTAMEGIAKQQAQIKFYEDQLAALEKDRASVISGINARLATGQISSGQAVSEIADAQGKLLPQITAVAAQGAAFAQSITTAKFDPTTAAALSNFQAAPGTASAATQAAQLKIFEDNANALVTQEQDQLKSIADIAQQGGLSATAAFDKANTTVKTLGPAIQKAASDALALAEAINATHPSPEITAFIAKMQLLSTQQAQPSAQGGPLQSTAAALSSEQESKMNDVLSTRSAIIESINTQETAGDLTHEQAQSKIQATYAEFTPLIQAQTAAFSALITSQHDAGAISDQVFEAMQAKIAEVNTQTKFVSSNFTELRSTITQSFTSGVVNAFDTITTAVGAAIDGTGSWKDALSSLGTAALQFGASFLKSIGDMLVQMLALKAIQSLPGLNGLTSGLLGATGLAAPAAALGTAGTTVVAGGVSVSAGAAALGVSAAALGVSAAALAAANAAGSLGGIGGGGGGLPADLIGLLHTGTVRVGSVTGMSRAMPLNPGAWANAPRYHTGYAGVGLSANEQRAILKKGEEVLTSDNPRNIMNIAKSGGTGGGSQGFNQRIIAVFDEKDIHAAMASSQGEAITIAHVKKNASTVRQVVKAGSRGGN